MRVAATQCTLAGLDRVQSLPRHVDVLAGAVAAEKAEDAAFRHDEAEDVHGGKIADCVSTPSRTSAVITLNLVIHAHPLVKWRSRGDVQLQEHAIRLCGTILHISGKGNPRSR